MAPVLGGELGRLLCEAEAAQAALEGKQAALAFVTSVVGLGGSEEGARIARVIRARRAGA